MAPSTSSLAEKPSLQDVHALIALFSGMRYAEAATVAQTMTNRFPRHPFGWKLWGAALIQLGQHTKDLGPLQHAVALAPADAEVHSNLGAALRELGRLDEALSCCRRAVAIRPDYAGGHNNLGAALKDRWRLDEAIASYQEALALSPSLASVHSNLGGAFLALGRLDEAVASYRRALEINPDDVVTHSNMILALLHQSGNDEELIATELRRWNGWHAAPLAAFILPHTNDRSPDRRLRIGYVSPDFRSHPVGWFLRPLLAAHDRQSFEIFCYSLVNQADDFTAQLRLHATVWRELEGRTDREAADVIRADQIDILVDLALHTAGNRLPVFALKPAPVQVTYLAYPGNSGLATIDYRITDCHLDPPERDTMPQAEWPFRLPETYWCYQPIVTPVPAVNPLPALATGRVTFGCLNNFCKVTQNVLVAWTRILAATSNASLIIHAQPGANRLRVQRLFSSHGIDSQRVRFVARTRLQEYFQTYHLIDIALDPFPFPGGTTTCDALWMGVPVISLTGPTPLTRGGLSLLNNVGLGELVGTSMEEYVDKAVALAGAPLRLAALRGGLRERMQSSPLMNAPRFARHMEAAYRTMWQRWCVRQDAAQNSVRSR